MDMMLYSPLSIKNTTLNGNSIGKTTKKPLAVFHVGPHKTGSTSMQLFIFNQKKLLRRDNYWAPNKMLDGVQKQHPMNPTHLAFCLQRSNKYTDDLKFVLERAAKFSKCDKVEERFKKFASNVKARDNKRGGFIMSSEEFDLPAIDIEWLKHQLEPKFEVRIIIYYRHFPHWLMSNYNQYVKNKLRTFRKVPSITEWLHENLEKKAQQSAYHVYKRYSDYFPPSSIKVLNYDDHSIPLEEKFFCNAIPDATQTCNFLRANSIDAINTREDISLLSIIANLHYAGFPKANSTQAETLSKHWDALQSREEGTKNKTIWFEGEPALNSTAIIHRKCPSKDTLEKILTMSQSFNEGIKSALSLNQTLIRVLDDDFHERLSTLFCNIDADRIIDHWKTQDWFKAIF